MNVNYDSNDCVKSQSAIKRNGNITFATEADLAALDDKIDELKSQDKSNKFNINTVKNEVKLL